MSLLFIDGFADGLGAAKYVSGSFAADAAYGRVGGNGGRFGNIENGTAVIGFPSLTSIVVGMAVYLDSAADGDVLWGLGDEGRMRWYADGSLAWRLGTSGAVLAQSSPGSVPTGAWHYVELKLVLHNSTGAATIAIDGVVDGVGSGIDTAVAGSATALTLGFDSSAWIDRWYCADLYVADIDGSGIVDFLGDVRVETVLPSGNGTTSDLIGSDMDSTDNYLLVDEATPSTADFVQSAAEGDLDTYTMSDLASSAVTVHGVQTCIYATKSDAGNKFIRPVIRSGTTNYPGTSKALAAVTYLASLEVWEQDPDTAAAWTASGVNAMEVGQEVRDS
jgi:hypothetical protein